MLGGAHRGVLEFSGPVFHDPVADLADHLLQKQAQMAARAEICRRDVPHAVGVGGELVALSEGGAAGVLGVVHGDGVAPVLTHDGEAGDIGGAVPDVNHIVKGDRADPGGHVVVHILRHGKESLVDAEQVLGFLGVGNDPLREGDATAGIFGVFAAKYSLHVRSESAAFDENFEAAGDDVVLDLDAVGLVQLGEESLAEFLEHLGQAGVKAQAAAEFFEAGVGGAVHSEAVEEDLHVGQFVVEALFTDEILGLFPESSGIDAEGWEQNLLLHIVGTERLVVVVDDGNDVLRGGHMGLGRVRGAVAIIAVRPGREKARRIERESRGRRLPLEGRVCCPRVHGKIRPASGGRRLAP